MFGQGPGRLDPGGIVERGEGVQGGAGASAPHGAGLAIGGVKHVGGADRSPPEGVQAPPVEIGGGRGRVGEVAFLGDRQRLPDLVGLIGIHRSPSDPEVDQATRSQRHVAEHHRGHPEPARAAVQAILRVCRQMVGPDAGVLPVGGRRHEQPVHLFLAPATLAELHGQPVEQIHMRRIFPLHPHVFDGLHETNPEKVLPHPVDLNPRGERLLGQEQPASQAQPVAGQTLGQAWQRCRRGKRERVSLRRKIVAAVEDLRLAGRGVAHHHHAGNLVAFELFVGLFRCFIPLDLRKILNHTSLHVGVEVAAELLLDRFLLLGRAVFLPLPQERCERAGEVAPIGRLAVGKEAVSPRGVGGVDHSLRLPRFRLHGRLEGGTLRALLIRREFDHRRGNPDPG